MLAVVLPWRQERQRGEVADLAGVEVGLEREVELGEGLVVRQPGELQRGLEASAFAQPELLDEEQVDEVAVAHCVGLCALDEVIEVLGEVREPEAGGVVVDAGGDQFGHAAPTSDRSRSAAARGVTSPARTS